MKISVPTIAYYTSPKALAMIYRIAEFERVMVQLSTVTGLPVSACADIVRNTCKDTDYSWEKVAAHLKWKVMKGGKIHD